MLMYFHCLDADKLWFMLVDPQALIWFGDSTWIVLSYGLKNGRLVQVLSLQHTDHEPTTSSNIKLCC